LGIGDWGLGPIPNPQSPIPNPQSPIPMEILLFSFFSIKINNYLNIKKLLINIFYYQIESSPSLFY
jgi:hypothetical protein